MLTRVRAKTAALVAGALLASAGAGVSGAPAHAASGDCSTGALCVYAQPFFSALCLGPGAPDDRNR